MTNDSTIPERPVPTVIASRDKDLRMCAGWHYSWKCGERQPEKPLYEISELEGYRNWAKQMLTGDTVDNIWGVPGYGPVKAAKAIEGCEDGFELEGAVINVYLNVFGEDMIPYQTWDGRWVEKNWKGVYKENYDLLWMLESKEEIPV